MRRAVAGSRSGSALRRLAFYSAALLVLPGLGCEQMAPSPSSPSLIATPSPSSPAASATAAAWAGATAEAELAPVARAERTPGPQRVLAVDADGTTASVSQGGIVDLVLRPAEPEQPFFGVPSLRGDLRPLWLTTLAGSTRLRATGLVDALAPLGSLSLSLALADRSGSRSVLYLPTPGATHPPQVQARAAIPLVPGTTLRGQTLALPRSSNLYQLDSGADDQLLLLRFVTSGSLLGFALSGAVAPASGHFAAGDFFYASLGPTSSGSGSQTALAWLPRRGASFAAVFPASFGGGADYAYDLTALLRPLARKSARESTPPDSPTLPLLSLTLDGASLAEGGAIDRAGDIDYIQLSAPRELRVYVKATIPGQGLGGTTGIGVAVALTGGDCKSGLAPLRPVQQEAALAAGSTACAVLSSPAGYVGPYTLLVAAESP